MLFRLIFHAVEGVDDPQAFFGDLPATGGDMAHFIRVALVDRLQHLQNLHIVARRTHQRVVVVRLMRHRLRVDVVIIELLAGVLHALRGQQRLCRPRDILMAQAGFEMEVMLADKVVAIDVEPGDV